MLLDVTGLLESVGLKSISCFRDIFRATYLLKGVHFEAVTKNLSNLFKLMGVIGGKDQFHPVLEYYVYNLARYNYHLADRLAVNIALCLFICQNCILNLLLGSIGRKVQGKTGLAVE